MSTEREPIAAFGIVFQSREEAIAFYPDYDSDSLDDDGSLGLEYFEHNDEYVLGYRMEPGVSYSNFSSMWEKRFGNYRGNPTAMLLIRSW